MQYLISVIEEFLPGGVRRDIRGSADDAERAAVDTLNDRLVADGQWIFAGGLAAPNTAVVFDDREGAGTVSDGPSVTSDVNVGGFWVLDLPDDETARRIAAEASRACNRRIELRPLLTE